VGGGGKGVQVKRRTEDLKRRQNMRLSLINGRGNRKKKIGTGRGGERRKTAWFLVLLVRRKNSICRKARKVSGRKRLSEEKRETTASEGGKERGRSELLKGGETRREYLVTLVRKKKTP